MLLVSCYKGNGVVIDINKSSDVPEFFGSEDILKRILGKPSDREVLDLQGGGVVFVEYDEIMIRYGDIHGLRRLTVGFGGEGETLIKLSDEEKYAHGRDWQSLGFHVHDGMSTTEVLKGLGDPSRITFGQSELMVDPVITYTYTQYEQTGSEFQSESLYVDFKNDKVVDHRVGFGFIGSH